MVQGSQMPGVNLNMAGGMGQTMNEDSGEAMNNGMTSLNNGMGPF